jgi:hypothetical protein
MDERQLLVAVVGVSSCELCALNGFELAQEVDTTVGIDFEAVMFKMLCLDPTPACL